ncbi:carboxylesterase/lipase family protein ['Paenibacillus yunnanensis' Narsing Rao et al. 2020]|uniref:carboxylesterase/lipase family protein n=1 Tax=Paenibacillus tengchongensis TaxID=2608684 RepID=UPI00124DB5BB|nr:carboxylesterase/lipase family protein [Paenibacillus tengchongensis]
MIGSIADTAYGRLQGIPEEGVCVWRGIPYAAPPVQERRFAPPVPPESWSGVRDAGEFGPVSLQPVSTNGMRFAGTTPVYAEDCLYLNVWSPAEEGEKLPVMVWIHGGTFVTGAGSQPMFEGSALARSGRVVVVTVNYRLGPLGFLHLAPLGGDFASNLGLLDQISALRWVQDNIGAFGGDPAQVTVFGESAGSMSIAALLAMPAAKGLFARAILQSGAAQCLQPGPASAIAGAFLGELGLVPGGDLVPLRRLPAEEIMNAAARMAYKLSGNSLAMLFQPVLDPATLPVHPEQAIASGSAEGIPLLIGTNLHEGHLFFREEQAAGNFAQALKSLELALGSGDLSGLAAGYPQSWEGQADLLTDLLFWGNSLQLAERQLAHAPVWMYRFDWAIPGHPLLGRAVHGAEIYYVFHTIALLHQYGVAVTPEMERVAGLMQKTWTAFARSGNPAVPEAEWPPYSLDGRATLIIGGAARVENDPDSSKREQVQAALSKPQQA